MPGTHKKPLRLTCDAVLDIATDRQLGIRVPCQTAQGHTGSHTYAFARKDGTNVMIRWSRDADAGKEAGR